MDWIHLTLKWLASLHSWVYFLVENQALKCCQSISRWANNLIRAISWAYEEPWRNKLAYCHLNSLIENSLNMIWSWGHGTMLKKNQHRNARCHAEIHLKKTMNQKKPVHCTCSQWERNQFPAMPFISQNQINL